MNDPRSAVVTATSAAVPAGVRRAPGGGRGGGPTAAAGRTPTLHQKIYGAAVTDREAARGAGAGRIP